MILSRLDARIDMAEQGIEVRAAVTYFIRHKDGNPRNYDPANLELVEIEEKR
jgi:hypothetical protein